MVRGLGAVTASCIGRPALVPSLQFGNALIYCSAMCSGPARTLTLVLASAAICVSVFAGTKSNLRTALDARYQGRVLILRHPFACSHLVYGLHGNLVKRCASGSWTLDDFVEVQSILLKRDLVSFACNRVEIGFAHKRARLYKGGDVEIDVGSGGKPLTLDALDRAFARMFLRPREKLSKVAPSYWKPFFSSHKRLFKRLETEVSQFNHSPSQHEKMTLPPRLLSKPVSRPVPGSQTNPSGQILSVFLQAIVGTRGNVLDVTILKALGLGLDDDAVRHVRKWKFRPATRNSRPVAISVGVEIDYMLTSKTSTDK